MDIETVADNLQRPIGYQGPINRYTVVPLLVNHTRRNAVVEVQSKDEVLNGTIWVIQEAHFGRFTGGGPV